MSVALQPAGNPESRKHYNDTIESPVDLSLHSALLGGDYEGLLKVFPKGSAQLWGVTPGLGGVNIGKYNRLSVGDTVLFARDGIFFWAGTVAYLLHNKPLATTLWGTNHNDQTWEYMYALDEGRNINLPRATVQELIGERPSKGAWGFKVVKSEASYALEEALGLESRQYEPEAHAEQFNSAVHQQVTAPPTGPTDKAATGYQRTEQAYLRKQKIPNATGVCDLCGTTYGKEFLVCAHIKARSVCTEDERRDWKNVTMLACKFGCDELYERGFLTVGASGTVQVSDALVTDTAANQYATTLEGRKCSAWQGGSADYFKWHRENRSK